MVVFVMFSFLGFDCVTGASARGGCTRTVYNPYIFSGIRNRKPALHCVLGLETVNILQ